MQLVAGSNLGSAFLAWTAWNGEDQLEERILGLGILGSSASARATPTTTLFWRNNSTDPIKSSSAKEHCLCLSVMDEQQSLGLLAAENF